MAYDGSLKFDTAIDEKGFNSGLNKLGGIASKGFGAVTKTIGAVSTAMAAVGVASIKVGSEFETSFSKASTLFGDVAVDTDNLSKKMLDLSSATGVSANELNETLYQALSAGVPVTEDMASGLEAVQQATELAKGGFTDSASAIDILTTASNAYADAGYSMQEISDVLITTQNKGKTTVDELSSSLGRVLPIASGFGVSLQDVGASMATMTANGIATAESTTYLKSILNELGDSGSNVSKILQESTGQSFDQLIASGASLGDVIGILGDSVGGDAVAFNNLWSSSEAGVGALSILNTGTEKYNDTLSQMQNSTSATSKAFEKMSDTFETKAARAQEGIKNLGISLYEGFKDNAKAGLDVVNDYITQLQDAFNEDGVNGLIEAGGNILANVVQGIAEKAPEVINMALNLITTFAESLSSNSDALGTAGADIVTTLFNAVLEAGTTLLDVGLELLSKIMEGIASNPEKIKTTIKDTLLKIATSINENLPSILESGIEILLAIVDGIAESLPELVPVVVEIITNIVETIVEHLPEIVESGINLLLKFTDGILNALPKLVQKLPEIINNILKFFNENFPKIIKTGGQIIGKLLVGIIKAIPGLIVGIVKLIPQIVNAFLNFNWLSVGVNLIEGIAEGVMSAAGSLIDSVIQAARDALNGVKDFLGIHSPSRVMRDQVGKYMAQGVGVGFTKEMPNTTNEMVDDTANAVNSVKSAITEANLNVASPTQQLYIPQSVEQQEKQPIILNGNFTGKVEMDGREVGIITAPIVSEELGLAY